MKLKVSHLFNLALSAFALILFALNLRTELAGEHFNLRTGSGATILTIFLVAGVVVQLSKLAQGHETAFELSITLILLVVHVVGDVYIWYRTQIQDVPLPAEIPFLIIGGYWLIGVIDFASMFLPEQMKLYTKGYKTPQQKLLDMERQLLELQAEKAIRDRQREQQREQRQGVSKPVQPPRQKQLVNSVHPRDQLYTLLTVNPDMSITEMARQIGKVRGTVHNYLKELEHDGRISRENDTIKVLSNGHH